MWLSAQRVAVATIVLLGLAAPARGEPILVNVTSGTAEVFSTFSGSVNIFGDHGFSLDTSVTTSGLFQPRGCCLSPGTQLPVRAAGVGGDLIRPTVTILGRTFPLIGEERSGLSLFFASETVTIPPLSDAASVQAPFTFSGFFGSPQAAGDPIDATLTGRGTTTLFLTKGLAVDFWVAQRATFEFTGDQAPIPEPSTMLLTGAAVLSAFGLKRRRRWGSPDA